MTTAFTFSLTVGRTVVIIIRCPASVLPPAAVIVQHRATLRAEQLACERIGFAYAVRSSPDMQNILGQLPFGLRNNSFVRVLEDQPFFLWIILPFSFQAVLHRTKVDSVAHILWPSQDVTYRRTVPGIGFLLFKCITSRGVIVG